MHKKQQRLFLKKVEEKSAAKATFVFKLETFTLYPGKLRYDTYFMI